MISMNRFHTCTYRLEQGPYNAWLDPIVISEWQEMAYNEIQQMTEKGVPGVWTHNYYDGWAPSYGFYVANGHNGT